MRSILLIALAATATLLPTATALPVSDCYGVVCVGDFGSNDCSAYRDPDAWTGVEAYHPLGYAYAQGYDECDPSSYHEDGIQVGAEGSAHNVRVGWYENGYGSQNLCHMRVTVFVLTGIVDPDAGCPVGAPPSAAWGDLLP